MNLMIIGHGRHGKDTLARALTLATGLLAEDSSFAAARLCLFDRLRDEFGYQSILECWADRHRSQEMRDRWYREIKAFNTPDKCNLMRAIYQKNDIYVGLRDREEFLAGREQGLFDLSIWVDASERYPQESPSSISVLRSDADLIVENNGTVEELSEKISRIVKVFGPAVRG